MCNPKHSNRDWNWLVEPNPAKPTGWQVRVRVLPAKSQQVRFFDGFGMAPTHFGAPCRVHFECGHHVVLGLSCRAAFTLLVYVWNRWKDKSKYASPIWQLHHKSTYTFLCTRIGPTGYEPGRIIFLGIINRPLTEERDIWGCILMCSAVYLTTLTRHPHNDFYRHIDCEVQWLKIQTMGRGDGASLGAEAGLRYSHGEGWVAWESGGAGCNRSREIGTSGCSQRLCKTTWYCVIDNSARHGATVAGIVHGDHGCAETLGKAGDGVKGDVKSSMSFRSRRSF